MRDLDCLRDSANPYPDDTDAHTVALLNISTVPHPDTGVDTHTDGHVNTDTNAYADAHVDIDPDTHTDAHVNANAAAHPYTDPDAHTDTYSTYFNANQCTDGNLCTSADRPG